MLKWLRTPNKTYIYILPYPSLAVLGIKHTKPRPLFPHYSYIFMFIYCITYQTNDISLKGAKYFYVYILHHLPNQWYFSERGKVFFRQTGNTFILPWDLVFLLKKVFYLIYWSYRDHEQEGKSNNRPAWLIRKYSNVIAILSLCHSW